jgi:hypothetical protein
MDTDGRAEARPYMSAWAARCCGAPLTFPLRVDEFDSDTVRSDM